MARTTEDADSHDGSRVRIWRAIARLNVGGPARHVVILDTALREQGMVTMLVHGRLDHGEATMRGIAGEDHLTYEYVESLGRSVSVLHDLRALLQLVRSIYRFRPHIVHTHTAKAGALGRVAATLFNLTRRRSRRCVIVHTFHGHVFSGYFGRLGNLAARLTERCLAVAADAIIVISNRQRDDIVERFAIAPARKVNVVELGLRLEPLLALQPDSPSLRGALGIPERAVVFGFIGRFAPIKDVPMLVEAFLRASAACPDAHLLLIGDGETRAAVEEDARRSAASDRIHFLGWCTDVTTVFATIDVAVLTSRNEGTPVALIEAMAAAKPVVATDVGGVSDVVEHGETGLLVAARDSAACAAAMVHLATDEDLRRRMGARGREGVRRFDQARLTRDISSLYARLLAARRV